MTGAGPLSALGYGSVKVMDDNGTPYEMHNVMYLPSSPVNLFSTIKLNQEGGKFLTTPSHATLFTKTSTLHTTKAYKGIFSLSLFSPHEFHAVSQANNFGATLEQWHSRLGHVGVQSIQTLCTA